MSHIINSRLSNDALTSEVLIINFVFLYLMFKIKSALFHSGDRTTSRYLSKASYRSNSKAQNLFIHYWMLIRLNIGVAKQAK